MLFLKPPAGGARSQPCPEGSRSGVLSLGTGQPGRPEGTVVSLYRGGPALRGRLYRLSGVHRAAGFLVHSSPVTGDLPRDSFLSTMGHRQRLLPLPLRQPFQATPTSNSPSLPSSHLCQPSNAEDLRVKTTAFYLLLSSLQVPAPSIFFKV